MITYAIIAYVCLHDKPWSCFHGPIGVFSSEKQLSEFCSGDAPQIVFRWQSQNKGVEVKGWDCERKS